MINFTKVTNFLSGLLLIRFSLSKLFAWPISVSAFIEMAKPLGIDPTFFRLFTGVIITIVCLGYFYSLYLLSKPTIDRVIRSALFNILGSGVMIGALGAEFFLRVEPKWPLVYIALFIVASSFINLVILNNMYKTKITTKELL